MGIIKHAFQVGDKVEYIKEMYDIPGYNPVPKGSLVTIKMKMNYPKSRQDSTRVPAYRIKECVNEWIYSEDCFRFPNMSKEELDLKTIGYREGRYDFRT